MWSSIHAALTVRRKGRAYSHAGVSIYGIYHRPFLQRCCGFQGNDTSHLLQKCGYELIPEIQVSLFLITNKHPAQSATLPYLSYYLTGFASRNMY
jgi:hypothetical protein